MAFANEPSGSSLVALQNFNGPLPPSNASAPDAGGWYLFAQSVSITTDSGALETPPNVGQWNYFPGLQAGVSPGNMFHSLPDLTSIFIGMVWKPSSPWQNESQSNVNKIFFLQSLNPFNTPGSGHFVPIMRGPGPSYTFCIVLESVTDNSHLGGFGDVGGTWVIFPNAGSGAITLGTWYRIEMLVSNSSSPSAKNGILRVWLNGNLVMNYTTVNTPDVWREFDINPTWGGLNNTKTQNDNYWYDHVRISNPSIIGPPPLVPTISSFTPTSGLVGTPITIVGTNFDTNPGGNSVTLNNTQCTVLGAQATQINTAVPTNATTGRIRVATSGGQATSSTDFTVTVQQPTGTGSLIGSRSTSANTTLSVEGTLDWAHWGLATVNDFNHKSGANLISNVSMIAGTKNHYFGNPTRYAWTGGTPTATASDVHGALYTEFTNSGFRLTVPADTTERICRVYGGAYNATLRVSATLSDNSAASYVDTSFSAPAVSGGVNAVWTFRYKAGEAGQTLRIDILNASAASGNSQLHAATLQLVTTQTESITLSPSTLTLQEQQAGSLTLTIQPVRATSSIVTITNSAPTICAVPSTVTIPASTTSTSVQVTGTLAGTATITASLGAQSSASTVTVIEAPEPPPVTATPSLQLYTSFLDVYRWI